MARKKVQEERKRQILKALDECLQEKSFEKTSIKDIARVAGVNHGVLHYYFTGKEDILLNYIDYVIADYQGQAREWLGSKDLSTYTKTGFIDESGRCLVMQASVAQRPVVIVLLDAQGTLTRFGDANRIKKWMERLPPQLSRRG